MNMTKVPLSKTPKIRKEPATLLTLPREIRQKILIHTSERLSHPEHGVQMRRWMACLERVDPHLVEDIEYA